MTPLALSTFDVQRDRRTITVTRSFSARLDPIWSAWTRAEILCQWWAPKPYVCVIKSLDFREGGRWLYYMQGPQGDRHWCCFDYETIRPKSYFSGNDAFCDEQGVANAIKPRVRWEAHFQQQEESTIVRVVLHFATSEDLEQLVRMGFKEGFTLGLDQLDVLLANHRTITSHSMSTPVRITVAAFVNKPVAQVWSSWTDPAHITQWNAASDDWHCPKASNDLRAGGTFTATMAARDGSSSFDFEGVYDDVQLHKRVAYTMADGRTCEVLFTSENGGTRVEESFDAEGENPLEMQRGGWQAILDRFKAYTEAQA